MCSFSFPFNRLHPAVVGCAGEFTFNMAAAVSAAYTQNPPAIATKNPLAPTSSQLMTARAHPALAVKRAAWP
jgi:hypothetical protein